MSKFDTVYGGRWFKAADLDGGRRQLQIEHARWEPVGVEREEKLVLAFRGENKESILNVTNARRLAERFGKDESRWSGRWVEASVVSTTFGPGLAIAPIETPTEAPASIDVPF